MEELTIINIIRDFIIAFIVGFCWAILFGSPKRLLWVAGFLGGMGHSIRFVLIQLDFGLITATLAGSVLIGLVGIFAAHKVHSLPVVFTMPACITMIPGMFAYKTMLGGIKSTDLATIEADPHILIETAHNLMLTMSLLFTLAIGICIGALLFRKNTTKDISFRKIIGKH